MSASADPTLADVAPRRGAAGVITRQREPINVEFPFEALADFATPNEQFYVRSHFPMPSVDATTFRLRVEGHVERAIELSLDELRAMASETRAATLECAGNGRVLLVPQVAGAQWELGAVSNARWTGVPLAAVLARAGVRPGAIEVMFQGADKGKAKEPPSPPGEVHYAHSVPMRKVPDVLLAHAMNGTPLPPPHGAPLRAVVGGWYGMASVKWVERIVVLDQPFLGYFRAVDYAYWVDQAGQKARVPIEEMSCKAQVARPAKYEVVPAGGRYVVCGAAWTGESDVVRVEFSADGGQTFADATLLGEPTRHAWRFWRFDWQVPTTAGRRTLMARATDARGRTQPAERNPDHGTYLIDHVLPIEVDVA